LGKKLLLAGDKFSIEPTIDFGTEALPIYFQKNYKMKSKEDQIAQAKPQTSTPVQ